MKRAIGFLVWVTILSVGPAWAGDADIRIGVRIQTPTTREVVRERHFRAYGPVFDPAYPPGLQEQMPYGGVDIRIREWETSTGQPPPPPGCQPYGHRHRPRGSAPGASIGIRLD